MLLSCNSHQTISCLINPFPNKPLFLYVCSTSLKKTVRIKEKLLVTRNFSFFHNIFYPFGELYAIFCKLKIVVCYKLLVMSNSSFSHNVFYPFGELYAVFSKLKIASLLTLSILKRLKFVISILTIRNAEAAKSQLFRRRKKLFHVFIQNVLNAIVSLLVIKLVSF